MYITVRQEPFQVPPHVHSHLQLMQISPYGRVSSGFIVVCRDHDRDKGCYHHSVIEEVASYPNARILKGGMVNAGINWTVGRVRPRS